MTVHQSLADRLAVLDEAAAIEADLDSLEARIGETEDTTEIRRRLLSCRAVIETQVLRLRAGLDEHTERMH